VKLKVTATETCNLLGEAFLRRRTFTDGRRSCGYFKSSSSEDVEGEA